MLERVINFVRTDGVQLFIIGGGTMERPGYDD